MELKVIKRGHFWEKIRFSPLLGSGVCISIKKSKILNRVSTMLLDLHFVKKLFFRENLKKICYFTKIENGQRRDGNFFIF